MWRLVELSAKYELPFQIHTGHGRIQGSNPMNLVDLIEANPRTKFILFHGGFPWVGETGIILMRHSSHVWLDSVWMPTLSYATSKRAFHEWLDVMPSSRIMWGADANHAEGIYGATEMTRAVWPRSWPKGSTAATCAKTTRCGSAARFCATTHLPCFLSSRIASGNTRESR